MSTQAPMSSSFLPVWAIVENPGTSDEKIVREFKQGCYGEALRTLCYYRQDKSTTFDLMKRGKNGALKTEF